MESETVVSEIVEGTSPSQDIKVRINGFRRLTKPFYNFFLLEIFHRMRLKWMTELSRRLRKLKLTPKLWKNGPSR